VDAAATEKARRVKATSFANNIAQLKNNKQANKETNKTSASATRISRKRGGGS